MNLYELSIHRLHQMRMQGEVTTLEIVESVLKRIEEVEGRINAFIFQTRDTVQEKAVEIDRKIRQKQDVGLLAGMPIAVKDIFATKGIQTTCGSKILKNYISPYESTVTQKLLDADYSLVGKANMDEFAMGSSSENSAFGATRNPWNLDYVPGGSSSGSAAAVAAGMALGAMGTDTGGSIRQPASFTGLVGLKPTYGRVSRYGMAAYASSLDQGGPITRDVEDAAWILETIAGHDVKDSTSLKEEAPSFTQELNQSIQGMKIGVIKELKLEDCDSEVVEIFENNLAILREGGAEIVEIELPNLEHAVATYYVLAPSEASSNLGRYDGVRYGYRSPTASKLQNLYEESRDDGFGAEVKLRILMGTFALSSGYYDAYYLKAQQIQNLIRHQFHKAFQKVDAIATPVSPIPPFRLGEKVNDPLQMYLADAFTIPANLAGIPGISVPGGFTKTHLPVGFQLLGAHSGEGTLIRIADFFEKSLQIQRPPLAL